MSPNFVTGILGALAIILAFIGFGSLPLNVGGLLLIGLAIVLFVLELTVVSHGLLADRRPRLLRAGRVRALHASRRPARRPSRSRCRSIVAMTARSARVHGLIVPADRDPEPRRIARGDPGRGRQRCRRSRPGTSARSAAPLAPVGSVYAAGEEWSARTRGRPAAGARHAGPRRRARTASSLIVEPIADRRYGRTVLAPVRRHPWSPRSPLPVIVVHRGRRPAGSRST